ncbi:hypothetical protein [Thiospirillum jenense]|uniref:RHS repeat protein n=1 Tax=Thiospirillum jenense TaxID=1653858 RepID=A0A839HBH2_9GAMM|nr:hypothetical protein [Thiospirillum jenense]MBB1125924.1 hypothetical protein [Thiospirillum jenense]
MTDLTIPENYTELYDENGILIGYSVTDGSQDTLYDLAWNITGYRIINSYDDGAGFTFSTVKEYDADWFLIRSTYSDSTGYQNVLDQEKQTDEAGNLTGYFKTVTIDYANDAPLIIKTLTYDANWQLINHIEFDGFVTSSYNAGGYLISQDADLSLMTTALDENGTTLYTYTSADGMTHNYDATGHAISHHLIDTYGDITQEYFYNGEQNLIKNIYHDNLTGFCTTTELQTLKDVEGNITGAIKTRTTDYADGFPVVIETIAFNADGIKSNKVVFDGIATTTYDADGNLISQEADTTRMTPTIDDVTAAIVGYHYASANGFTHHYDLNGQAVWHHQATSYDDGLGYNSSNTNDYLGDWTLISATTTDSNGYHFSKTRDTLTNADGLITNYVVTTIMQNAGSSIIETNINTYDSDWQLIERIRSDGYITMTYDSMGQITNEVVDLTAMTPTLDDSGQIIGYSYTTTDHTHYYDVNAQCTGHHYFYSYTSEDGYSSTDTADYDEQWHLLADSYSYFNPDGTGSESSATYDHSGQVIESTTTVYSLHSDGEIMATTTVINYAATVTMEIDGFTPGIETIDLTDLIGWGNVLYGLDFDGSSQLFDLRYDADQQQTTLTIDVDGVRGGNDAVKLVLLGVDATSITTNDFTYGSFVPY